MSVERATVIVISTTSLTPLPGTNTEIEPLKLACQHFVNCCASGQKARSDGANGYAVVSVLEEAEKIMLGSKVEDLNKKDFALSRMKV